MTIEALPGERRDLPSWLSVGVPLGSFAVILGVRLFAPENIAHHMDRKEGAIEWVSALLMPPAVWAGMSAWRRARKRGLRAWIVLGTLTAFYLGMEEISWGQHLWGWSSPEVFQRLNDQGETNVHNMTSWLDQKPRLLFELGVLVGGIVVPWLVGRPRLAPWLWPTRACLPVACLAIVVRVPDRLHKVHEDLPIPALVSRGSEPQEMYFAMFLFLYLLSLRARLPTNTTPSHRGDAAASSGVPSPT